MKSAIRRTGLSFATTRRQVARTLIASPGHCQWRENTSITQRPVPSRPVGSSERSGRLASPWQQLYIAHHYNKCVCISTPGRTSLRKPFRSSAEWLQRSGITYTLIEKQPEGAKDFGWGQDTVINGKEGLIAVLVTLLQPQNTAVDIDIDIYSHLLLYGFTETYISRCKLEFNTLSYDSHTIIWLHICGIDCKA